MKSIKLIGLSLTASMLSGCSYFYGDEGFVQDTSYAYLEAEQGKSLTVPDDLMHEDKIDYTPVPEIGAQAKQAPMGREVEMSAPIQILAVLDNVRVNKQASQPTVYILENKTFLWDSIVNLFSDRNIELTQNDSTANIIETGWVAADQRGVWLGMENVEELEDFRTRYRFTFDKGILRGEQQVTVERFAAERLNDDTGEWQAVPTFWQDSAQMLNMMISHYDAEATQRDQLARAEMIAGFDVRLARDENDFAALVTSASLEVVWEKLPNVLQALDFEINDRDRRLMTYFTSYEFEEPGFFASLFDSDQAPLPLETGDYQVTLREFGEGTAIIFRDGQGTPLETDLMVTLFPSMSELFGKKR